MTQIELQQETTYTSRFSSKVSLFALPGPQESKQDQEGSCSGAQSSQDFKTRHGAWRASIWTRLGSNS